MLKAYLHPIFSHSVKDWHDFLKSAQVTKNKNLYFFSEPFELILVHSWKYQVNYPIMKRTDRYFRLVIILIISVASLSGLALVNSPTPDIQYFEKLDKSAAYEAFIQGTLSSNFENSLIEVDIKKQNFPLNFTLEKSFEISNRLFDVGLVYHIKINDKFRKRKALRKMLDVLSENYVHIRRESMNEKNSGDLHSLEEQGYVYNENERFSYINKIITQNDEAWILILTFNDQSKNKVRDLLNLIWIEKEKVVS